MKNTITRNTIQNLLAHPVECRVVYSSLFRLLHFHLCRFFGFLPFALTVKISWIGVWTK